MNDLGIRLLWLMGQVTLLPLAVTGLAAVVARRRPGVRAAVTLCGLCGVVALTLLAILPIPGWWSWTGLLCAEEAASAVLSADNSVAGSPAGSGTAAVPSQPDLSSGQRDGVTTGGLLVSLRRLWDRISPALNTAARQNPHWSSMVVFVLLTGTCISVGRLIVGLYAVRHCRAKSRRLNDRALNSLLAGLCGEMGCRRPVAVRQAPDIGGPVTVGWRRPVVLLPPQWREWGADELRAVLAHEIAHVCRADYAAWLMARLGVALHFYHPLVHWLAGCLHLQQELAADALGATHAGGRRAYVRALARLALRQDDSLGIGPARAFLPVRGTLMRRIAMLRTEEMLSSRCCPRLLVGLSLGVVVLAVSALRDPAQAGDKALVKSPQTQPAPETRSVQPPPAQAPQPFVYCVWPPDAAGFFAFRPSDILTSDPRMRKMAGELNKSITDLLKAIGGPTSFPRLEEIEQVSGGLFLKVDLKAPKGQRGQLVGSLLTLRTKSPYDWKKMIDTIAKKVTEMRCEGRTYYKVAVTDFKSPALFGVVADSKSRDDKAVCFFQPDERTVAVGSEQQFRDMIKNGPNARPAWAVAAGWEHVERGLFAVAINNAEGRFANSWLQTPPEETPPEEVPADIKAAIAKTTAMVFGIDYTDGDLRADLFSAFANREDAATAAESVRRWVLKGAIVMKEALAKPHDNDAGLRRGEKFLSQTSVEVADEAGQSKQSIVHLQGHAKIAIAELIDELSGAKVDAVEVKGK